MTKWQLNLFYYLRNLNAFYVSILITKLLKKMQSIKKISLFILLYLKIIKIIGIIGIINGYILIILNQLLVFDKSCISLLKDFYAMYKKSLFTL